VRGPPFTRLCIGKHPDGLREFYNRLCRILPKKNRFFYLKKWAEHIVLYDYEN